MKNLLLAITLSLTALTSFSQKKVFICDSPKAYAYHSTKTCRGLNRCSHEILTVTEENAIKVYKRRKCRVCY